MPDRRLRLAAIRRIISRGGTTQQEELLAALARDGFTVTQSTLSRDLRDLRVARVPDGEHGYRYGFADAEPMAGSRSGLVNDIKNGLVELIFSSNLLVVRTLPGHASQRGARLGQPAHRRAGGNDRRRRHRAGGAAGGRRPRSVSARLGCGSAGRGGVVAMKVAVLGATGYAGATLARLLAEHPDVETLLLASSSRAGAPVAEAVPELSPRGLASVAGGTLASVDEAAAAGSHVVFSALPHLSSAQTLEPFLGRSVVVDLSADFRIADPERFEAAYGQPPARPDLLGEAVYGLPERYRDRLRSADLIASPGCFPTTVLLPLLPVLEAGLVTDPIVACAVTGLSRRRPQGGRRVDILRPQRDRGCLQSGHQPPPRPGDGPGDGGGTPRAHRCGSPRIRRP